MNYNNLEEHLRQLSTLTPNQPFIINLNIGTTMTGAMDQIDQVNIAIENAGVSKENIMIHADAALTGFIYPFIKDAPKLFQNGVASLAVSGHKFPGAIHPSGIVIARKDIHNQAFSESWVPYVGTNDTCLLYTSPSPRDA